MAVVPIDSDYVITAITGPKGDSGDAAKYVEISAPNGTVFKNGLPSTLTLTCESFGFTPTLYKWYKQNGNSWTEISGATTSTYTITYGSGADGVYKVIADNNNDYSDIVTIIAVSDGQDGADGTSPYACSVSNENFSIATDYDLKPVETKNYDIEFTAYKGSTQLTAVASNPTTGQFSISQPTGLTKQSDNKTLRFSASTGTAIPANASYEVTVYYEGTSVTETKVITVSSAKSGNGIAVRFSQSPLPDDEYLELSDGTDLELHNGQGLLIEAGNKDGWHYPFAEGDLYMQTWSDIEGSWSESSRIVGEDGAGIASITRMYLASSLETGVTRETTGWNSDPTTQTLTPTLKYLWTYDIIEYTDTNIDYTEPCISGTYGETGTKTFFSDVSRTWTNSNWNAYKAAGYTGSWSNSTVDGMRVGDVLVISATLSEQGNITGTVYAQITSVPSSKTGSYYEIPCTTLYGMVGQRGQQGNKGDDGYSLQVSQDFLEFSRKLNGNINEATSSFTVMLYKGAIRETALRYTDVSVSKDSAWGNELTVSVSENASPADGTVKVTVATVANQNKALKDGNLTVTVSYGGSTYTKTIPVTTVYNGRYLGKATALSGTSVTIVDDSDTSSAVTAKIGDTVVWRPTSTQSYTQGLCYELQTYDNSGTVAYSWVDVQGNAEAYSTAFGDIMKLVDDRNSTNPAMIMAKNLATNMAFIGSLFANQITMMKNGNIGGIIKSNGLTITQNQSTGEITGVGNEQGWAIDYYGNAFFNNANLSGDLKSQNFALGQAGFHLKPNGTAYINELVVPFDMSPATFVPWITSITPVSIDLDNETGDAIKTKLDSLISSYASPSFSSGSNDAYVYCNIVSNDNDNFCVNSKINELIAHYLCRYTENNVIYYVISSSEGQLPTGSGERKILYEINGSIGKFISSNESNKLLITSVSNRFETFCPMTSRGHINGRLGRYVKRWGYKHTNTAISTKGQVYEMLNLALSNDMQDNSYYKHGITLWYSDASDGLTARYPAMASYTDSTKTTIRLFWHGGYADFSQGDTSSTDKRYIWL